MKIILNKLNSVSEYTDVILRLSCSVLGMLVVYLVSVNIPSGLALYLQIFAISNVVLAVIPLPSFAYMVANTLYNKTLLRLSTAFMIIALLLLTLDQLYLLGTSNMKVYYFSVLLSLGLFFEKIALVFSAQASSLSLYYFITFISRVLILVYLLILDTQIESILYYDFLLRTIILLVSMFKRHRISQTSSTTNEQVEYKAPCLIIVKERIASYISNLIYVAAIWLPFSGVLNTASDAKNILDGRICLFIAGFSTVFYLRDDILSRSSYNKFGILENTLFRKLIYAAAAGYVVVTEIANLLLVNLLYIENFSPMVLLSIVLLIFSESGAKLIRFHSTKRELLVAFFSLLTSAFVFAVTEDVALTVVATNFSWLLSVSIIYQKEFKFNG